MRLRLLTWATFTCQPRTSKFLSYQWLTTNRLSVRKRRSLLPLSSAIFPQVRFLSLLLKSLRARRCMWWLDKLQLVNSLTTSTMTKWWSMVVTSRDHRMSNRATSVVSSIQTEPPTRMRSCRSCKTLKRMTTGIPSPTRSIRLVVWKTGTGTTSMVTVSWMATGMAMLTVRASLPITTSTPTLAYLLPINGLATSEINSSVSGKG